MDIGLVFQYGFYVFLWVVIGVIVVIGFIRTIPMWLKLAGGTVHWFAHTVCGTFIVSYRLVSLAFLLLPIHIVLLIALCLFVRIGNDMETAQGINSSIEISQQTDPGLYLTFSKEMFVEWFQMLGGSLLFLPISMPIAYNLLERMDG